MDLGSDQDLIDKLNGIYTKRDINITQANNRMATDSKKKSESRSFFLEFHHFAVPMYKQIDLSLYDTKTLIKYDLPSFKDESDLKTLEKIRISQGYQVQNSCFFIYKKKDNFMVYLLTKKNQGGSEVIVKTFNEAKVCEIVDKETVKLDVLVFKFFQGIFDIV